MFLHSSFNVTQSTSQSPDNAAAMPRRTGKKRRRFARICLSLFSPSVSLSLSLSLSLSRFLSLSLSFSLSVSLSLHFTSLRRGRILNRGPAPGRPLPQLGGGRSFRVTGGRGRVPPFGTDGVGRSAVNPPTLNTSNLRPRLRAL